MYKIWRFARKFITIRREQQIRALAAQWMTVKHQSSVDNVYHCCVWKTASQWVRNLFSSLDVYRYSGLLPYNYQAHEGHDDRPLQDRAFEHAFPLRRIVSPLYTNYEHFAKLPKPAEYRAFFVMRDPRDLVVSHYFSSRYSHVVQEGVLEERSRLEGLSEREGMLVHMRYMAERGIFEAIRSWVAAEHEGEPVRVVRFEDLVGAEQLQHVLDLLRFCDIATPEHKVVALLERLSFAKLSGGRKQGQENKHHKYRSGKAGDWKKYFDDEMLDVYHSLDQGLSQVLNYA